jgi:amino acid transporter
MIDALAAGWRELALYLAAGAVYVAIGVAFPEFLFTWFVAAAYLLVCVVALPALVRVLRR